MILEKENKRKFLGGLVLFCIAICLSTGFVIKYYHTNNKNLVITGKIKNQNNNALAIQVEQEDGSYRKESDIPTSGYVLNEEKSLCNNGVKPKWDNNRLFLSNLTKGETSCYLTFDKLREQTSSSIVATIKNSSMYKGDSAKPDFTSPAEGDGTKSDDNSGVYRVLDPMYGEGKYSYYFRGAVLNNYVMFANKCWRIVRINGDGTIRLIYDGKTCHANGEVTDDSIVAKNQTYSKGAVSGNNAYVGYTFVENSQRTSSLDANSTSNLKKQIDDWFNNNANFTAAQREQVETGYFCNDRRTKNDETWIPSGSKDQYYAAYARIAEGDMIPSLSCYDNSEKNESDIYMLKVGAITADEAQFAGASYTKTNTKYYLYNGQSFWTMSPFSWFYYGYAQVFIVFTRGSINDNNVRSTDTGVRPVINLKTNVTFNATSDGTQDNPYIVLD